MNSNRTRIIALTEERNANVQTMSTEIEPIIPWENELYKKILALEISFEL